MVDVIVLLTLATFGCLILGLIVPRLFKFLFKGETPSRKKVLLIFGGTTVSLFLLFAFVTKDQPVPQIQQTASQPQQQPSTPTPAPVQAEQPPVKKEHNKTDAYVMSQDFVSSYLKSPSTAKFPAIAMGEVGILDHGDGTYEIASYVDSQNSYGAMMRNKYLAVMRYVGNKRWVCDELYMGPNEQNMSAVIKKK